MTTQWREKYLVALEEQERLEKQVAAHADMLRRTVVHLSSASDGLDKTLDTELLLFKEKLRGASGLSVSEQLTRVEQAVKKWHHERASQTNATCKLLKSFANEFEKLRLDSDTQKSINSFKRTITPESVELYKQFEWLKRLLDLQNQAIHAAAAPDKNLWQRLNGGTRLLSPAPNTKPTRSTTENTPKQEPPIPSNDISEEASIADSESARASNTVNTSANSASHPTSSPAAHTEPPLHNTIHITHNGETEQLLHEIFSAIVPTEELADKIVSERKGIDEGVTEHNINHFLRAIRDILQASYMNYGAEFSDYLMHMNAELTRICQAMDSHLEDTAKQIAGRVQDTQNLEESQGKLAEASQQADIDNLKYAVMEHLTVIEKSLAERKHEQDANLQSNKKLKQVAEKLQKVEVEAKATKGLIEKEQHQANRDALTNLVNRTGCSQRLEQECDRFQRYHHPITLGMCNIDGLTKFNDYGYIIGDRVLKLVATTLRERLRSVDFIGRYHGDKFLLILPETPPETSKATLEKISQFLAKTPLNIKGKPVQITLSFSLTTFKKEEDSADSCQRMTQGFEAIKEQGGNCIRIV